MSFKIEEIKGVGKNKNILNEIGVFTTDDLLLNFPKIIFILLIIII